MSDYLPTELLIEILLKLPVKSLIRFTAVSKTWHSLITSPSFISSHLSNSRNDKTLLLRRYDNHVKQEIYSLLKLAENRIDSFSHLQFPFKSQIGYFRIVGCCDGIVCLSDDFFANPSQPVVLWNPSVKNYVLLPKPIVNPSKPHIFVLGFGVFDYDYKVVRLVYSKKSDFIAFSVPPEVEIFSLKTGRWRKLSGVDVKLQIVEFMWCQVFLNGVVHWLAYESLEGDQFVSSILTFCLADEVFDEMQLPDELAMESVTNLCVFSFGDSIAMVKYDKEFGNESCDVWLMKEYGVKESWTKLFSISFFGGLEKVVAFMKSGEVLVASQDHELVAYNPETRQLKDLGIYGTVRSFYIDDYVESLLLLRGESEIARELSRDMEEDLIRDGCSIV